jgi:hypothetical protein
MEATSGHAVKEITLAYTRSRVLDGRPFNLLLTPSPNRQSLNRIT